MTRTNTTRRSTHQNCFQTSRNAHVLTHTVIHAQARTNTHTGYIGYAHPHSHTHSQVTFQHALTHAQTHTHTVHILMCTFRLAQGVIRYTQTSTHAHTNATAVLL